MMRFFASIAVAVACTTGSAAPAQERFQNTGGLGLDLSAANAAAHRTELEYRPAARIGLGWDSLGNVQPSSATSCLVGEGVDTGKSDDPRTEARFRLVETKTDTMDSFGLNATAAFRSVGYSVNGSLEFAKQSTVSTGSVQVAGRVDVQMRTETLVDTVGDMRIAPEKMALLESGDIDAFLEQCGDSFIYQISRGGKLSVLLDIATASDSERTEMKGKLGGERGGFSVSVEAMKKAVESSERKEIDGKLLAIGGIVDTTAIASVDELKAVMDTFPAKVDARDAGRRMVVQSYWSLLRKDHPYTPPPEAIEAARRYYALDAAWQQMNAAWSRDMKGFDTSMSPGRECLGRRMDELRDQLKELRRQISDCASSVADGDPDACAILQPAMAAATGGICPTPPQLVPGPTHSAYDYLVFLAPPGGGLVNRCEKDPRVAAKQVWDTWINPVWRADCASDPDAAHCKTTFKTKVLDSIPVTARTKWPRPGGSYGATCRKCSTRWSKANETTMTCSCRYHYRNWLFWEKTDWKDTSATFSCTSPPTYANCQGVLTKGDKC